MDRAGSRALCGAAVLVVVAVCPAAAEEIDDFLYWINGPDPERIAATEYDLVVADYSRDGSAGGELPPEAVARMQRTPRGRTRPVLAYLSIGEAETYRWYWRREWDGDGDGEPDEGAPGWLGSENPEWEGNYKVRYWDPDWQALIAGSRGSYLDRILDAGFDGVYLDIVDAYYYWGEEAEEGERIPLARAADRMIALIEQIRAAGLKRRPGFLVFPQNADFLPDDAQDDRRREAYFAAIDGIGIEDVFFRDGDSPGEDAPFRPDEERLTALSGFVKRGKRVLSIEYPTRRAEIDRFFEEATRRGFVPFAGRRPLDGIPEYPGPR
ncbi:MAG: endo alpha-1,4 polygalactosaminidase [Planctomycetes bacterium]|nr:endo alpha-1,4 polygalactosaminidase [Planctomycetota bacterium]